jgi:Bacterial-like globin
MQVNIKI